MHPGEVAKNILLAVTVAYAGGLQISIIRHLEIVSPRRTNKPKLVVRGKVEDQRGERPSTCCLVVQVIGCGSLQAMVSAVAVQAEVISRAVVMIAKAELVVSGIEVSVTGNELTLAGALKAGARYHVEDAVGAVARIGGEAAALHLHIINGLGIELRPHVVGAISIGNRHSVDRPGNLVSAAHVQLIVHHGGAGNKVGDHGHSVGAVRAGSLRNLAAA